MLLSSFTSSVSHTLLLERNLLASKQLEELRAPWKTRRYLFLAEHGERSTTIGSVGLTEVAKGLASAERTCDYEVTVTPEGALKNSSYREKM